MLRPLLQILNLVGIPRLVLGLFMESRVPLPIKAILPAAVAYLIIPFDLLPDIVTPFGRIDDVLVLIVALVAFLTLAPKHVVSEHARRGRSNDSEVRKDDGEIVEGKYRYVEDGDGDDSQDQTQRH